ncbi:MAG TPA: arginine--tRNA ligase [Clostridia bacterium]|jgi:arginyl-tRNA synthetase|nr:arginine--tRNA ligase [Clostridia bacterium]
METVVGRVQAQLRQAIAQAVEKAVADGVFQYEKLPEIILEVPREKAHGDYATNLAMLLTRQAKQPPRKIAEAIVARLPQENKLIARVEIAGPGFINFYLTNDWLYAGLAEIGKQGENYGKTNTGKGRKVQVEFVSANPTGPLHMGNGRGGAIGSVLANLLETAGFDVTREFYINDAGNQIENFGLSLEARYLELLGQDYTFPEKGYRGEDIKQCMADLIALEGDKYLQLPPEERRKKLVSYALKEKLTAIKNDLAAFGVEYDVWFSEQSLYDSGKIKETLDLLQEKGYLYEKDGAIWLKTTLFGDDKDEVVVRANGVPTYFAADIAYHRDKFERGFTWIINIWGADHHGHVARMKGAMAALGYDPDQLDVIIMQLVRLVRKGEQVRMSKRAGEMVTLSELVEEVGKDAARFFFLLRSADSHLDFDLDLAKEASNENPVYYVQYAHARICSILRQAAERGVTLPQTGDLTLLKTEAELDLIRKLVQFPEEIALAALRKEPHRLARYVHDLAGLFHSFYNSCRVISDDEKLTAARLVLVDAARIVLRNSLNILGITAPERM